MCSASRTIVAVSVGVMEALKDQGFCRWSNPLRAIHQHAKTHLRTNLKKLSSTSESVAMAMSKGRDEQLKRSEESLRTVMYLSCWGPNS